MPGSRPLSEETLRDRARKRLSEKSRQAQNGCIEWIGFTRRGYGATTYGHGRVVTTHRLAYALANGLPMPFNGVICHRCDNRACINPDHLFLGTYVENNLDRDAKGRTARGERHGRVKLTADQVRQIRADTRSREAIAADYGVHPIYVGAIKRRVKWKHVD